MMDHIRQRDWCSTRLYNEDFVDLIDTENCVVERIIRNQFWDPLISSDEDEPVGTIDWDSVFKLKNSVEHNFRVFVPGYRNQPPHPKVSALTQDEHRRCIKVLSAKNLTILPKEFIGRPSKADIAVFEEKQAIYTAEQKEYREWAKQLWISTNCIRALRPKPTIEMVYEAEFKMRMHMMKCFPKTYTLAAQIPLRADNQNCEIILPKKNLIQVDISSLPEVDYPDIYEGKVSILQACTVPEPCVQHPCKFKLPNESTESMLPLTEIYKELAQFALENGADYIASESAIKCLLETDRNWCLPVSVCEVVEPDGDKSKVVVLGSEFPMKKDPAPVRSYRAYRHLLVKAFTSKHSSMVMNNSDNSKYTHNINLRSRHNSGMSAAGSDTQTNTSPSDKRPVRSCRVSTECHKDTVALTNTPKKKRDQRETIDDSDDEYRLEIVLDDDKEDGSISDDSRFTAETDETYDPKSAESEPPRKKLKARTRRSTNRNSHENSNHENSQNGHEDDHDNWNHDNSHSGHENNHDNSNHDNSHNGHEDNHDNSNHENSHNDEESHDISKAMNEDISLKDQTDIGPFNCVCKDSDYEKAPPRSYKNWQIKNHTTKDQINIIIHNSHKLRNERWNEVVLEPVVEYQLDVGATEMSLPKMQALAFSLMLRKNADLVIVRVDGKNGEVVTMDVANLKSLTAEFGGCSQLPGAVYTVANQLAGLLPGMYLLKHEPAHGANALLYARAAPDAGGEALTLDATQGLPAAEEARLVQAVPALAPVLLPMHKYRRQLPLSFTYDARHVAKDSAKLAAKKKVPPAAIQPGDESGVGKKKWPKKNKNKRKWKKRMHDADN